jgi:hypothetical protein
VRSTILAYRIVEEQAGMRERDGKSEQEAAGDVEMIRAFDDLCTSPFKEMPNK